MALKPKAAPAAKQSAKSNVPPAKKPTTAVAPKKAATAVDTVAPRKAVGAGFEEADAESYALPFLIILQAQSPQVEGPEAIPEAEAGMIMNTVTGELFQDLEVIACAYQRRFIRWASRGQGGGFKGMFSVDQAKQLQADEEVRADEDGGGRLYYPLPDGSINDKKCDSLSDTRQHYVLAKTENGWEQAVLAMASSQVKTSKQWMSKMQLRGGNMFAHIWSLGTAQLTNDKGTWYGWTVGATPQETPGNVVPLAADFYKSIAGGKIEVKMDQMNAAQADNGFVE